MINTDKFKDKLQDVMEAIYDLLELTREHNLNPVSENGVMQYMEECGKTCFQVSRQYDRPTEFLQTLLDIIRVNYEPHILGTYFLNSNLGFLYDEVPETPFQLAYASLTSMDDQKFSAFWNDRVIPYLDECGYNIKDSNAVYLVATTGDERYDLQIVGDIRETVGSGFSFDEGLKLIQSTLDPSISPPRKQYHTGYCFDPVLGNKIRLSIWFFSPKMEYSIQ